MHPNLCFQINQPAVIAKIIEGEAIIVNLDTGAYYSLTGTGADIWALIEQGASANEMTVNLLSRYIAEPDNLRDALAALLTQLQQEALITATTKIPAPSQLTQLKVEARPPFQKPMLEKFTDMSDLLLLDPIHEVDAAGWPYPASGMST